MIIFLDCLYLLKIHTEVLMGKIVSCLGFASKIIQDRGVDGDG